MDAFLVEFQDRIRDSKSHAAMLELFKEMLQTHRGQLGLTEGMVENVNSEFQEDSQGVRSRAAIVEIARDVLDRLASDPDSFRDGEAPPLSLKDKIHELYQLRTALDTEELYQCIPRVPSGQAEELSEKIGDLLSSLMSALRTAKEEANSGHLFPTSKIHVGFDETFTTLKLNEFIGVRERLVYDYENNTPAIDCQERELTFPMISELDSMKAKRIAWELAELIKDKDLPTRSDGPYPGVVIVVPETSSETLGETLRKELGLRHFNEGPHTSIGYGKGISYLGESDSDDEGDGLKDFITDRLDEPGTWLYHPDTTEVAVAWGGFLKGDSKTWVGVVSNLAWT
jgi:hypothetical protein